MSAVENIIIIWSWPAGHTAAIYAARANLNPLMFEGFLAGWVAAGGQLTTTTEIENFPGFVSIGGPELMMKMREQSLHAGTRIETKTVDKVDLQSTPFKVFVGDTVHETKTIIIATGATAKRLHLPGEETYRQRGISACAVCDGGLPFFRNKHLVVIGWGDTACEEASFLTKFASKVSLLVRRDELRASKAMQQRVFDNPKIEVLRHTEGKEVIGDGNMMTGIIVTNNQTGQETTLDAGGLFYAIGHTPNTGFLEGQIETDDTGYVVTYSRVCEEAINGTKPLSSEKAQKFQDGKTRFPTATSVSWVFAAGDVQDKRYRQAITSAGTWCMAAMDAEHWIVSHN